MRLPKDRPFVVMSTAMSVDGKIGTPDRRHIQFSNDEDAQIVDALRADMDAIMVGGVTFRNDEPRLTIKNPALVKARLKRGQSEHPLKVTVVSKLLPSDGGRFFKTGGHKVVFTTRQTADATIRSFEGTADIHVIGADSVDLRRAMVVLRRQYDVRCLLVEGGSTINYEMLRARCVDHLRIAVAPLVFGGENVPTLVGGAGFADQPLRLRPEKSYRLGQMTILEFAVDY